MTVRRTSLSEAEAALVKVFDREVEAAGLSYVKLAKKAGISGGILSPFLAGKSIPRYDHLAKLAAAMEVPLWKLVQAAECQGTRNAGEAKAT